MDKNINEEQKQCTIHSVVCSDFNHDWQEEYYGHTCSKCGLFYPHGGAPWDDLPEDRDYPIGFDMCNEDECLC